MVAYGLLSWEGARNRLLGNLAIEAQFAANAANSFFDTLANDLPFLAQAIARDGHSLKRQAGLLKTYDAFQPHIASMALFSPTGRMLYNSGLPKGAVLPDPRRDPAFFAGLKETLDHWGLVIGPTEKGLVLHDWRIPVRYVIRGPGGKPLGILQAAVLNSSLVAAWKVVDLPPYTVVGLLHPDGLHAVRFPSPHPARLYQEPASRTLMAQIRQFAYGSTHYQGVTSPDGSQTIGAYSWLRDFPLVAYVSVPVSTLRTLWWQWNWPFFAMGLLGLLGFFGMGRFLFWREERHGQLLRLQARRHPLTGLPNQLAAEEWIDARIPTLAPGEHLVVVLLGLDRFRDVNDALGSEAGDRILQELGGRLRGISRQADFFAHLSGDRFILAAMPAQCAEGEIAASRLLGSMEFPLSTGEGDTPVFLRASVGIACYPGDGECATSLLVAADSALKRAKGQGGNRIAHYDEGAHAESRGRLQFQTEIQRALEQGEFRLYYQPIVELASGRIFGAEALVRWLDPERGMRLPQDFIPLAEEGGWIPALGHWILRRACADARAWQEAGYPQVVSVNLSVRQFEDPRLAERIEGCLAETGLPAAFLKLEVTESAAMTDIHHSIALMRHLVDLGANFAIDDFGTGYSSLAYLRRLPARCIKVDQSFIMDLESDAENLAIVRTVVAMTTALGRFAVAEGIETEAQYRILREAGVTYGQGHWFSPPLPEPEFRKLLMGPPFPLPGSPAPQP